MGIEAVIFDIGGVLEVTPPIGWQERWRGRLGVGRQAWDRRLGPIFHGGSVGALTLSDVEASIAASFGLAQTDLTSFMDDLWSEYLGTLNRPLAEYFADLRPRYRTGILSNSFVGARERERERYGFEETCDVVVYSHEEGFLKPDRRLYRIARHRLGVEPESCVFLDDDESCVAGALAVGMSAIRFSDNGQAIRELNHLLGDPRTRSAGPAYS